MYSFLLYNLKAAGCLAVFYLFYKLLLSRETFHRLNRAVLLGGIALCFVLPLCVITVERELPIMPDVAMPMVALPEAEIEANKPFPWELLGAWFFVAGGVVAMVWTLVQVIRTVQIIRHGRCERLGDGTILSRCAGVQSPFSWGRWIVISDADYAECGEQILIHERAHSRCGHSFDLLAADLLGCLQWFNPAMWLLRGELRMIHEYEADAAVLAAGSDAKQYQLLLIKKAVGGRWYSVANSLNHSKLKNRITMMLRKKSSRWARARMLFVLPLVCTALGAFARTAYVFPEDKGMKKNEMSESVTVSVVNDKESRITVDGMIIDSLRKPLILVDGRRVKSMDEVDAGQVAQVYAIKGDEAVRGYGERGRYGVINITTKKSEAGKNPVNSTMNAPPLNGTPIRVDIRQAQSDSGGVAGDSPDRLQDSSNVGDGMVPVEPDSESGTITVRGFRDTTKTHVKVSGLGREVLVIVDGRELLGGEAALKKISPEQIESISVLKDQSAVALYGERAHNGAILITTKLASALKQQQGTKVEPEEKSSNLQLATGEGVARVNHTESGTFIYKGRVTIHNVGKMIPDDRLIFINGERATKADVERIEPLKIKRMEVLTGDDALKEYGEAGTHGVIVIKTRR